jgi:hypothetical protein
MKISNSIRLAGGLALLAAMVGGLTLVACPLSHDKYETDRPCWGQSDCVKDELCGKVDACAVGSCPTQENTTGFCAQSSDGPCGLLDAGIPGFLCFPDENGNDRHCYFDEQMGNCTACSYDASLPRNCEPASCLEWQGRYGCR